jgi:hypothetical protein
MLSADFSDLRPAPLYVPGSVRDSGPFGTRLPVARLISGRFRKVLPSSVRRRVAGLTPLLVRVTGSTIATLRVTGSITWLVTITLLFTKTGLTTTVVKLWQI